MTDLELYQNARAGDLDALYEVGLKLAYNCEGHSELWEAEYNYIFTRDTADADPEDVEFISNLIWDRMCFDPGAYIDPLLEAAERGHAMAAFHAGFLLHYVDPHVDAKFEAKELYEKAIELADLPVAKYHLAVLYRTHLNNPERALALFAELEPLFDDATYQMGLCAMKLKYDQNVIKDYFLRSAERGYFGDEIHCRFHFDYDFIRDFEMSDPTDGTVFLQAEALMENNNPCSRECAYPHLVEAAARGNAEAMKILGDWHRYGPNDNDDTEEERREAAEENENYINPELAFSYYRRAAERGRADAMAELGVCYYEGIGTPVDYYDAFFWLEKGQDSCHSKARLYLGYCHLFGRGTKKDLAKAILYLRGNDVVEDLLPR